jgi:hypothetical protein
MALTPLFAGFLVTWAVFMVLGGIYFAGRSRRSKEDERNLRFVIIGVSALMSFIAFLMLRTT